MNSPKIAIVGGGIAGLGGALLLGDAAHVDLYEREPAVGGHIRPHTVKIDGRSLDIDTGFFILQPNAYPLLVDLFDRLGVDTINVDADFTIWDQARSLAFRRSELVGLMGKTLPSSILDDYTDFGKVLVRARHEGAEKEENVDLGTFFQRRGYSPEFAELVVTPMVGTLWGIQPEQVLSMSARTLFAGPLRAFDRPPLRVGPTSSDYLDRLRARSKARFIHDAAIAVVPADGGAIVKTATSSERYDRVIVACHADQAKTLLAAPTPDQDRILSSFTYVESALVIHGDDRVLPAERGNVAPICYARLFDGQRKRSVTTIELPRLFGGDASKPLFSSASSRDLLQTSLIDPAKIADTISFRHAVTTPAAAAVIPELPALNRHGAIRFAGSYFGYSSSHEDAFRSALELAQALRAEHGLAPVEWPLPYA
ncbi:FAD-dependent oxidoreductase [Myxococcota bacterium]|nr:FAD-dependent oxidoreductase [Myxococcota bacterium]